MKRAWAILLLPLISLSLIDPAMFVGGDSQLPACCRRHGKHECAMMDMAGEQQFTTDHPFKAAREKCPSFPKNGVLPGFSNSVLPRATQAFSAAIVGRAAVHPQNEVRRRVSFSRSRQKRGPPIFLS
jgi:hypothetical protein